VDFEWNQLLHDEEDVLERPEDPRLSYSDVSGAKLRKRELGIGI